MSQVSSTADVSTGRLPWRFPLPRVHTGLLLGNGRLGAMVWGEANVLRVTLGLADLWDHRGGMPWTAAHSYTAIRDCLERGDESGLRRIFEHTNDDPTTPRRPSILPVGRFEIVLATDVALVDGDTDHRAGQLRLRVRQGGALRELRLVMDIERDVVLIDLPGSDLVDAIRPLPAWDAVGEKLAAVGFTPPRIIDDADTTGWTWPLPVDPAVAALARQRERVVGLTLQRGDDPAPAQQFLDQALADGFDATAARVADWFASQWQAVPDVKLPDDGLQFELDHGLFKFLTATRPGGVPCTLQGPWIEDYQLPPWQSDYHFNINVQMCYWPAYQGNRLDHLLPLFDLIESWMPTLRHNARVFVGIDDGIMLPHAVDDRGVCMGGFWTGSIDHQCTGWVAQMMWRYYRYTLDTDFLRRRAWPFLAGAMNVYEAMLEREDGRYVLPVSVSPEYGGSAMNAWGRNASTQLACIHMLVDCLIESADVLGERVKPAWRAIRDQLPKATVAQVDEWDKPTRIMLWEGQDLAESHRHHSHLAGICPFDVIDPHDPDWADVVWQSMRQWVRQGMGNWSGWAMPWAAMLHARMGNTEAPEMILQIWRRVFTNEGHGTRHDVGVRGFSALGDLHRTQPLPEKMQLDAGLAAVAALYEMLLYHQRGVHYLFAGVPAHWQDVSFAGMRTDGAFLVSAERGGGTVRRVEIDSPAGGRFSLRNPWDDAPVQITRSGAPAGELTGDVLVIETTPGERVTVQPAG